MEINRRQILISVLDTIEGISNIAYQKRIWIRGEGPECDDFDETVDHFFDDGDPMLENYKEFGITDNQFKILVKFRNAFDSFVKGPRPYLEEEFIDTPEWAKIVDMAKEVLFCFNYIKNN